MRIRRKSSQLEDCQKKASAMMYITGRDFDKEVLECDIPVFTCFTTRWCRSCYPTCFFADKLEKECEGFVKFARVDIEKIPEIAERYNIMAVPTILLFQNSQPVQKLIGFQEIRSLRALLDNVINESDRLPGAGLEVNEAR